MKQEAVGVSELDAGCPACGEAFCRCKCCGEDCSRCQCDIVSASEGDGWTPWCHAHERAV